MDFRAVICGPVACRCHACWRWVAAAISVCMRVDGLGLESVDRLLVWLYVSVAFTNNYRLCRRSGCQLGKITVFRQSKLFLSELEETPWSWFVVQCGQSPFSTRSQQHPLGAWHLVCALFPTKHFFFGNETLGLPRTHGDFLRFRTWAALVTSRPRHDRQSCREEFGPQAQSWEVKTNSLMFCRR